MWIQRLLQSSVVAGFDFDSVFRICREDAEFMMVNTRKKWMVMEKKKIGVIWVL